MARNWFQGLVTGEWYSPQERTAMGKISREARRLGFMPPAKVCNRCGQTQGVSYHSNDYCHPINHLEAVCFRCHMVIHALAYAPEACARYFYNMKMRERPPQPMTFQTWDLYYYGIQKPKGFKIEPPLEILRLYGINGFRKDGSSPHNKYQTFIETLELQRAGSQQNLFD